jgi:hypothetical protein
MVEEQTVRKLLEGESSRREIKGRPRLTLR